MARVEPVIRTARLVLTPIAAGDFTAAYAIASDARVMEQLGGAQSEPECTAWLERQLEHWRKHGYGRFRVDADERAVGFIGLRHFADPQLSGVELAWRLAFAEFGNGYATEAARACIEHGFSKLGFEQLVARTSIGNTRSRAVMHRLGMHQAPDLSYEEPEFPQGDPRRTHVVYLLRASEWA